VKVTLDRSSLSQFVSSRRSKSSFRAQAHKLNVAASVLHSIEKGTVTIPRWITNIAQAEGKEWTLRKRRERRQP